MSLGSIELLLCKVRIGLLCVLITRSYTELGNKYNVSYNAI